MAPWVLAGAPNSESATSTVATLMLVPFVWIWTFECVGVGFWRSIRIEYWLPVPVTLDFERPQRWSHSRSSTIAAASTAAPVRRSANFRSFSAGFLPVIRSPKLVGRSVSRLAGAR